MFDFPDLINLLHDEEERDEILEICYQTHDLILDDMGSGYMKRSGMAAGFVESILIHREAEGLSVLASTNLTPRQFRSEFGERVYDRVRGEWGRWIQIAGTSLRRKAESRT